tara:strand:+ start:411 stop:581 length:171 start_codon:yes stop_codon:yes gene_type:complete
MRMRVLARVGKVVVASDGVASPSRGFLAIEFLMAPCRVVFRGVVCSSSRLSLVASR